MKKLRNLLLVLILAFAPVATAQIIISEQWSTFQGQNSLTIPDMNVVGISDTRSLFSELSRIVSLSIYVDIESEFTGDLYLTVRHGSKMAVLMNRPGRENGRVFGYDDRTRLSITFTPNAVNGDFHNYQLQTGPLNGGTLTGSWQADGRNIDPAQSLKTTPRSATVDGFIGESINGEWTLFAADISGGGDNAILSWGITAIVPEPAEVMAVAAGLLLIFAALRKPFSSLSAARVKSVDAR